MLFIIAWFCISSCIGHIMINRFHKAINHQKLFARVCRYSRFETISFISIYYCAHIWDIIILFEIQQHSSDLMIRDLGRFKTIKLFLYIEALFMKSRTCMFIHSSRLLPCSTNHSRKWFSNIIYSWRCIKDNLMYIFVIFEWNGYTT